MAEGFFSGPETLPTNDEIEHQKSLSIDLYEIMEKSNLTTEARDTITEIVSFSKIIRNFHLLPKLAFYMTGSTYESTAEDKKADQDIVFIDTDKPVAANISNYPHSKCFLLLSEKQPGYFKLQLIDHGKQMSNGYPYEQSGLYILKPDKDNRLCLIQDTNYVKQVPGMYRHGPAQHKPETNGVNPETDVVHALKGDDWPDCASEWVTRQRDNGWPPEDLIMKCKTLGFFMVYTCHPASNEKEFQWRISFTLQERLLVTQFNSVQLKCYRLLKRVKRKIEEKIKEETLTSYHCKTCMFYMLENTPSDLWSPEKLVTCLFMCLRQLLMYVRNINCPNYFIPGENMLDRITSGKQIEKLREILEEILNTQGNLIADPLIQFYCSQFEKRMKKNPNKD